MMTEFERRYSINAHPGAIRFLAWLDEADLASYQAATAILLANLRLTTSGSGTIPAGARLPLQIRLWAELGTGSCEERRPVFAPGLE